MSTGPSEAADLTAEEQEAERRDRASSTAERGRGPQTRSDKQRGKLAPL